MTRNVNASFRPSFLQSSAFTSAVPLYSQRNLSSKLLFLAPAAVRVNNATVLKWYFGDRRTRRASVPYLTEAFPAATKSEAAVFQPTPSDLLIQQAEERFRAGEKILSRDRDLDHAPDGVRTPAVDLEYAERVRRTRRIAGCSKRALRIWLILKFHRDDLTGMGAAAPEEVPGFDKAPLDDIVTTTFPVDPRIKDKVQSEVKSTSPPRCRWL